MTTASTRRGSPSLERIAQQISDDVFVVAPETDQSGVAHSLSLNDPLRLREITPRRFALKGTPTDCVIMGVRKLMDRPPDLVLSGVNCGQNVAEDVTYSGTIAAAMEGTILGIPSIAMSQVYDFFAGRDSIHWGCAETHAPGVLRKLLATESRKRADERQFSQLPPQGCRASPSPCRAAAATT